MNLGGGGAGHGVASVHCGLAVKWWGVDITGAWRPSARVLNKRRGGVGLDHPPEGVEGRVGRTPPPPG